MGKHFLWDPVEDNIIEEFDDAGNTIADYTTEPTLYGDLISQHRDGQSSFYHYDGQGNTTSLTDSNANITHTYAYSAFGDITTCTGSTANPFQYIGRLECYSQKMESEVFLRRRVLSVSRGRWLAADPALFVDGTCRYKFVNNCPSVHTDPSGLLVSKTKLIKQQPWDPKRKSGSTSKKVGVRVIEVSPFYAGDCGEFSWIIHWRLTAEDGAGEKGAFVLQHVTWKISVMDCKDPPSDITAATLAAKPNYKTLDYWEAWPILPHKHVYDEMDKEDDTYSSSGFGNLTQGRLEISGLYNEQKGAVPMPPFKVGNPDVPLAQLIPTTKDDPGLSTQHQRPHLLIVEWNCCDPQC